MPSCGKYQLMNPDTHSVISKRTFVFCYFYIAVLNTWIYHQFEPMSIYRQLMLRKSYLEL
jgi:hypothetical protein